MIMDLAFVSNSAWNLYNFRGGLLRALLDAGATLTVIATHDEYAGRLEEMGCRAVGLRVDPKGTHPVRDLCMLNDLHRIYRKTQPDVVLHYTIKPVIYGSLAARMANVPAINTVTGLGTAFLSEGWLRRMVEELYRQSQRSSHRVFFQNPDDHDLFLRRGLVDARKAGRLPGSGVDLERYRPAIERPTSDPVFLLIARLLRDKGVVEFIDAARKLKAISPGARFQLLGPLGVANRTAIPEAEVGQWVRDGVVEYLGETEDVRPFIEAADCVVLPSYREGTPRSLLEAAAMARPLIATDVPGCREVVEEGVNGFLCRARDAEDLARAMQRFLSLSAMERRQMGLAGRRKMEQEFDENIVIGLYLQAIDECLKDRRGRR